MDTDILGRRLLCLLFVSGALLGASLPAYPLDADLRLPRVVVDRGGPYLCAGATVQKFYDAIEIPQEYLKQPLSMVCSNGSEKAPGYEWVRVFVLPDKTDQDLQQRSEPLGRLLVKEDSFLAFAQIYIDLSGQIKAGSNKICVEAAGKPGAVYSWEIRSIGRPRLYMSETSSTVGGAWLEIPGSGFSLRPDENTVRIGGNKLPVAQASFTNLRVFIPKDFPPGSYDLSVSLRSYQSNTVKLQILEPKPRQ